MGGGDNPFTGDRLQVTVYSAVLLSTELVGGWVEGTVRLQMPVYRCPFTALSIELVGEWVEGTDRL